MPSSQHTKSSTTFEATPLHLAILQNNVDEALKIIRLSPDALYIHETILSAHCCILHDKITKDSLEKNPSHYVRTFDGNIHSKEALQKWVAQEGTHPTTRESITWEDIESIPLVFTPADYLGSQGSVQMFEAITSALDPALVAPFIFNVFNIAILHNNDEVAEASFIAINPETVPIKTKFKYLHQTMRARVDMKPVPIGSPSDIRFTNLIERLATSLPPTHQEAAILSALSLFKKKGRIAHIQFNRGLLSLIAIYPQFRKHLVDGGDYNTQSFFKMLIDLHTKEPITELFPQEAQIQCFTHIIQTYQKARISCFVYFQK